MLASTLFRFPVVIQSRAGSRASSNNLHVRFYLLAATRGSPLGDLGEDPSSTSSLRRADVVQRRSVKNVRFTGVAFALFRALTPPVNLLAAEHARRRGAFCRMTGSELVSDDKIRYLYSCSSLLVPSSTPDCCRTSLQRCLPTKRAAGVNARSWLLRFLFSCKSLLQTTTSNMLKITALLALASAGQSLRDASSFIELTPPPSNAQPSPSQLPRALSLRLEAPSLAHSSSPSLLVVKLSATDRPPSTALSQGSRILSGKL